jgi:Concanavalin A-like lectin/glucanases superfamily
MNLKIIALIAFVIILLYVLYIYYRSSSAIASSLVNLNGSNAAVQITDNPNTYQYSFGVWVYVNSWDNSNQKPIFTIPNQINVYFDKTSPTLYVDIAQNCAAGNGNVNTATAPIIITDNFPIQKWTYVAIVADNFFIDLYVDGKMVKSVKLNCMQSVPSTANTSVYLGGNPAITSDIMLTRFYRWSYVLAPQDIWKQYLSGNGVSSSFATYGINVDVMRNNQLQNTIKLF